MGFLDDARRMTELKRANPELKTGDLQRILEREKHQAESAKFESYFAPSAVTPYVEVVPYEIFKRDVGAHVKTYIGIVGVQPEDMFAIYTEPEFEGRGDLNIVYRDRPEYEEGRRRYRLVIRGEGDQLTVLS